jgi:hypothetical protein
MPGRDRLCHVEIVYQDHAFDEASMPGSLSFSVLYVPLKDDTADLCDDDDDDGESSYCW